MTNPLHYPLSPHDRVHLLCWLTCGFLGAYYLEGAWPGPPFQVRAAHRWLERHHRAAEWIETARLSVKAHTLATRFRSILDTEAGRADIEQMLEADDLDYDCALVQRIYYECRIALEDGKPRSKK